MCPGEDWSCPAGQSPIFSHKKKVRMMPLTGSYIGSFQVCELLGLLGLWYIYLRLFWLWGNNGWHKLSEISAGFHLICFEASPTTCDWNFSHDLHHRTGDIDLLWHPWCAVAFGISRCSKTIKLPKQLNLILEQDTGYPDAISDPNAMHHWKFGRFSACRCPVGYLNPNKVRRPIGRLL